MSSRPDFQAFRSVDQDEDEEEEWLQVECDLTSPAAFDSSQRKRANDMKRRFVSLYPSCSHPSVLVRAPARVNLIGEHIDYEGFSVLPMAIDHAIWIMAAPCRISMGGGGGDSHSGSVLVVNNMNDEMFHCESFSANPDVEIDHNNTWSRYVQCGLKGAHDLLAQQSIDHIHIHDGASSCREKDRMCMCMVVMGTVPPSSGLSSSSALVVASAVASLSLLCHNNRSRTGNLSFESSLLSFRRVDIATACQTAEHYIGTMVS
jgi:galactokinase